MGQNIGDFFKSLGIDVNALKKELNSKSIQNTKKKKKKKKIIPPKNIKLFK
jgi:hypothetical protein